MSLSTPTKEELFYAELAGKACGDLELIGRILLGVKKIDLPHAHYLEIYPGMFESLQKSIAEIAKRAIEKAEAYSKQADAFSKAAFLERYEQSGESPVAPKSQAN